MTEKRELICIGCPMGCPMTVTMENGTVALVEGFTCKRGEEYARREVVAPMRMLTTTLPVVGGDRPVVAVKTAGEVPKHLLLECARFLSGLKLSAPVRSGEVVAANILDTGVNVIALKDINRV